MTSLSNEFIENPIYCLQWAETKIKEVNSISRSLSLIVNGLEGDSAINSKMKQEHVCQSPLMERLPWSLTHGFISQPQITWDLPAPPTPASGRVRKADVGPSTESLLVHVLFQVMVQKQNRHMSMSLYITSLAVSDSVALVVGKF